MVPDFVHLHLPRGAHSAAIVGLHLSHRVGRYDMLLLCTLLDVLFSFCVVCCQEWLCHLVLVIRPYHSFSLLHCSLSTVLYFLFSLRTVQGGPVGAGLAADPVARIGRLRKYRYAHA